MFCKLCSFFRPKVPIKKSIEQILQFYANKGKFPSYDKNHDKWILPKGYILFRCHPSNVLTPKQDYDTGKFGCYFCDNCPRLALTMVYEHKNIYPNGLVLSVYRLNENTICENGKCFNGNHYDTIIQSLCTWADYNATSLDSHMWCHEVFIKGEELYKLEQIDETFVTVDNVIQFYKTPSFDSDWVFDCISRGKAKLIGMIDHDEMNERDKIFRTHTGFENINPIYNL